MKKPTTIKETELSLEEVLFAFRRKLGDALRQESEDLKCPISHIDTLVFIAEKGTPTMKGIASHLKITPPSTTAIIEALQKKKLINRVTSDKDRRTIRIELTHKAWSFLKSLHERKFAIFTKMISKLQESERKQFIKILTILIKE